MFSRCLDLLPSTHNQLRLLSQAIIPSYAAMGSAYVPTDYTIPKEHDSLRAVAAVESGGPKPKFRVDTEGFLTWHGEESLTGKTLKVAVFDLEGGERCVTQMKVILEAHGRTQHRRWTKEDDEPEVSFELSAAR